VAKARETASPGEYDRLLSELKQKSFAGWPEGRRQAIAERLIESRIDDISVDRCKLTTQPNVTLDLYIAKRGRTPRTLTLAIVEKLPEPTSLTTPEWKEKLKASAYAFFAPRGLANDVWAGDAKKQVQIRRRFMLLGQTLDSMRVWDIRQAIQAVRNRYPSATFRVEGSGSHAVNLLYASLFEPGISGASLADLPASHQNGAPDYLNVLRVMDIPTALKIAESRFSVSVQRLAAGK
jgi:hypothetical protein